MARRTTIFRARTAGIETLVRDTDRSGRTLIADTREAFRDHERGLAGIYRRHAPKESSRMADSAYAETDTLAGGRVQLRVGIGSHVSPVTDYDYLEQSRFGRGEITSRGAPMILSLGRNKAGVASFRYGGPSGTGFRKVGGFRPANGDWVANAERDARATLSRLQRDVGQKITRHGILRRYG